MPHEIDVIKKTTKKEKANPTASVGIRSGKSFMKISSLMPTPCNVTGTIELSAPNELAATIFVLNGANP